MRDENDAGMTREHRRFVPVVRWDGRTQGYEWSELPAWFEELPFLGMASEQEVGQWVQSVHCCCSQA